MQIEVQAKGETYFKSINYQKGSDHPSARMTDQELIDKFTDNVDRTIPSFKIDKAVQTIFELEKVGNVSELIETVTI